MSTSSRTQPGRIRVLHEKFLVEQRFVEPRVRRNLYLWAGALAAVGLVAFVAILVAVVQSDGIATFDKPLENFLDSIRNPTLTVAMIGVAIVFGPVALPIIILVLIVLWTIFAKHFWRPLLLAGGTITGVIIVQIITRIVARPRPPLSLMLFGPDLTYSFPSGHVLGAADFLLIGTYLIFSRRQGRAAPFVGFGIAILLLLLTAFSRVYLGYHWPTDALGSIALSLVILGGVIALDTHRTVRIKPD
ncbi:MAG: phosphatase PAP2 family protein [Pseudolysinimonas sp.]